MQNSHQEDKKSVNAEEYINRHNLEPVLAEMLNTLVYEKVHNPEIFMIKYLSSLLSKEDRIKHGIHVPDSSLPITKKIVKYPVQYSNEIVKKHLTKKLWDEIKHKTTKYGGTVNDLLKEGGSGITLTDSDCFNVFNELVTGVINSLHEINPPMMNVNRYNDNPNKCIEYSSNNIQFFKFEYYRNLKNYPFPIKCKTSHLTEIQAKIYNAIENLDRSYDFTCVKFSSNPYEFSNLLGSHRIFLWDSPSTHSTIYHNVNESNLDDVKIFLVVNDHSHLRIIVNASKSKISDAYERLSTIHKLLDEMLDFEFDSSYGFLNSDIRKLGNALTFHGEFLMDKLSENKPELFEEIKKTFDISVLQVNDLSSNPEEYKTIKINLTQSLRETENEFLESVFQRIYNLEYINNNYNKDDRVADISLKIKEEEDKADSSNKNFYSAVYRAYKHSYNLNKFSHFHPNNITLNSIIEDILLNINNSEYFDLFPQFYTTYMMSFRNLYDDVLNKKILDQVSRNLQDFRDSLTNFDVYSFEVIKHFNMKIRRNIQGFNFSHYLSDAERDNLLKILCERISEALSNENFEFESSTNTFHLMEKQISIQLNKGDHLCFELDSKPRNPDLVSLIKLFFSIYQKITAHLQSHNIKYSSTSNLGYLTNDLRYTGTGITFRTDIEVSEKSDYVLQSYLLKDGFYLEPGTVSENEPISLVLGCNLNTNTGVYRIFNVLVDMFKSFKIPNASVKIKETIEVVEETI